MRIPYAMVLALMTATTFWSCDNSDSSTSAGPTTTDGNWDEVQTFPILGRTSNLLIVRYPSSTYSGCQIEPSPDTTTPYRSRVYFDTLPETVDTIGFRLDGQDRLLIEGTSDGTQRPVKNWSIWSRKSGAVGSIDGVWDDSPQDTVVALTSDVPDTTLARMVLELRTKMSSFREAGYKSQAEISGTSFSTKVKYGEPAAVFLINWNANLRHFYALDVVRVDPTTVRLIGGSDTVTLKFQGLDWLHSSSNPSHRPYTALASPQKDSDCPENPWFNDFLGSHSHVDFDR